MTDPKIKSDGRIDPNTGNRSIDPVGPSTSFPGSDPAVNADANPDLLTGTPGSHPIGTGIGAASAGAAGAVLGSVVPGIGTLVGGAIGAVVGALAGGYAGKAVAEMVNPTVEDEFWRQHHTARPYYKPNYTYEGDYAPAYRYGWESRGQYAGRSFDDANGDLETGWSARKGQSQLGWDTAKHAVRDAWDRVESPAPSTENAVRGNVPSGMAEDFVVDDSDQSTGRSIGANATAESEFTAAPNPPGTVGSSILSGSKSLSGAKSDSAHRNLGTKNVQTTRGNES